MEENNNNKMGIGQFLIRFAIYCVCGGIIPFAFLTWRFKLFSTISKTSIGGWGILAMIIVGVFIIKLIGNVKKILEPYPAQIVTGIGRIIIPLIGAAFLTYYMKDMMKELFQFICVLIGSELAAIIANPFPQWEEQHNIKKEENRVKNLLKSFINKENNK